MSSNKPVISIRGLYTFDKTVFDGLIVPEGIDRLLVINQILLECSDLTLLYPDYDFMKSAIENWAQVSQLKWAKLLETITVEYNPIENYDRIEEVEDTGENVRTPNLQRESSSKSSGGDTDTERTSAFDAKGFQNKGEVHHSKNTTVTDKNSEKGTDKNNYKNRHIARLHGNIGVTTTQQMLSEQRKIVEFTLPEYIANDFKKRFCILVY